MGVGWRRFVALCLIGMWIGGLRPLAASEAGLAHEAPPGIVVPGPGSLPLGPPPAAGEWRELPPAPAVGVRRLPAVFATPAGMPPGARFLLDPRTRLPRLLYDFPDPPRGADPAAAAAAFLAQYRPLLLGDGALAELQQVELRRRPGSDHVRYQQRHDGLPVWGGGLSVHLDVAGRVRMVNGTFFPGVHVDAPARLTPDEAVRRAMAEVEASEPLPAPPSVELGIYPRLRLFRLAYRVRLATAAPADWECFVDAATGAVLERANRGRDLDGSGVVVEENPTVTPGLVTRPFANLVGDGYLHGLFADVWVFDRVQGSSFLRRRNAYSQENLFNWSSDDSRFDEQMLYYHVTRVHDWYKSHFGFTDRDAPFPVHAHWPSLDANRQPVALNNAYFSPFQQALFFGDGTGSSNSGLNPLSRDADVIYHEYTHAVIDRITDLGRWPNDFGTALNEAYADYFSSTITGDPVEGEFASGRATGLRALSATNRFPQQVDHPTLGLPESHYTGIIWGASCWDLRTRLGADVADRLLFEALPFMPADGSADFPIALAAVLQADASVYGGEHQAAIREVYGSRGIYEPQRGYASAEAVTFSAGGRLASLAFASFDRLEVLAEDAGPSGANNSYLLNDLRFDLDARSTNPRQITLAGAGPGRRVAYDPITRGVVVGDAGGGYQWVDLATGKPAGGTFGAGSAVEAVVAQPLAGRTYFAVTSPGRLETFVANRRQPAVSLTARADGTTQTVRDLAVDLVANRLVLAVDAGSEDRLEVRDSGSGTTRLRSTWPAGSLGIADVGQLAVDGRQGLAFVVDNAPGAPARQLAIVDLQTGVLVDRIPLGASAVTDLAYDADLGVLVAAQAGPGGYTLIDVAARRATPVALDADVTSAAFDPITHRAALSTTDGRVLVISFARPSS
jgi:Zn-dependent metalloprotease